MSVRPVHLPADLSFAARLLEDAFQYPENEAWSAKGDEQEELADTLISLRRFWPLVRLIQLVSPASRDIMLGYVYEEDDEPVGMVNCQRWGGTDSWVITNVAVLPGFRRRGIARKLFERTLSLIHESGGEMVILDVIEGNVPAATLYQQSGFHHFSGSVQFTYEAEQPPAVPPLPDAYEITTLDFFDWRAHYELEARISPQEVKQYEPIEPGRFKRPFSFRLLLPVFLKAKGVRDKGIAIQLAATGQIVARSRATGRIRRGGVNEAVYRVDPAHAEVAPYLVRHTLQTVMEMSPGRRVEFDVPEWQKAVIEAAEAAGCVKRLAYQRMAKQLS